MGSFYFSGGFSKLPVRYGDDIVCLIGLRENVTDQFAPGNSFTPIFLPVYAKYNDYGGIEEVSEKSSAVAEHIERILGMSVEELVNSISCEESDDAFDKICEIVGIDDESKSRYSLSVIYEYEDIFRKMVSLGDKPMQYYEFFWQMPEEILTAFGYVGEEHGENRGYKLVRYTHPEYPALERDCYIYRDGAEHNCTKLIKSVDDIMRYTGAELPDCFKDLTWAEYSFKRNQKKGWKKARSMDEFLKDNNLTSFDDLKGVDDEKRAKLVEEFIDEMKTEKEWERIEFRTYTRNCKHFDYNIRRFNEYYNGTLTLCMYTDDELMQDKYMKDAAAISGLLNFMSMTNITWGVSHYFSECADTEAFKEFYQTCAEHLNDKVFENYSEEDDE